MAVSMEEKVDFIYDAIKDILPKFENLEKPLTINLTNCKSM